MSRSAPRSGVHTACSWLTLALALPWLGCGGRTSETGQPDQDQEEQQKPSCPPGQIPTPGSDACVPYRLVTGDYHTCLLLTDGAIRCWGSNEFGQLGLPGTFRLGDDETPANAADVSVGGIAVEVAAGHSHTCAVMSQGRLRCWGHGEFGQLGHANTDWIGDDETPETAGDVPLGGAVSQVAAGSTHTCAVLESGQVRCFGAGRHGRLGYVRTDRIGDDEAPETAGNIELGGTATHIATGGMHSCALLTTGDVRCWGAAEQGQLGYGNQRDIGDDETPASAGDIDVGGKVIQLTAGLVHTCALLASRNVRCWGDGTNGRLGYGSSESIGDDETPASAGDVEVGGPVAQVEAGDYHTCAVLESGSVRCWGHGAAGKLGYGSDNDVGDDETPASAGDVQVGAPVLQIALGEDHTCALLAGDRVRCWGNSEFGALGHGNQHDLGDDETPANAGDVPYL